MLRIVTEEATVLRYSEDQPRDDHGRFGEGDSGDSGDLGPATDASFVGQTAAAGYHFGAIDDPDGTLDASGDPKSYVEVSDTALSAPGDMGVLYDSAAAGVIAQKVDDLAKAAGDMPVPTYDPANGDSRPADYENGPAVLSVVKAGDYEIGAFHDAYGDLGFEGQTFIAIGREGESVDWDAQDLAVDLADAPAFSAALAEMADRATNSKRSLRITTPDATVIRYSPTPGEELP